jgi:RNase P/RNase MRP subunit p30
MNDLNLFKTEDSIFLKLVKTKSELSGNPDGYLIDSSEKEARKIIASLKDKKFKGKVALVGGDDAFNRRAIESLKIDYLISPEKKVGKNTLKQRDSGINHVVAKMAKEKGVGFVIDFSDIAQLDPIKKVARIEGVIQNIKICRKVNCEIKIASLAFNKSKIARKKEREAFGGSVGMSSSQSSGAVVF